MGRTMRLYEISVVAGLMLMGAGSAAPASPWRVENVSLRIDSERESTLTVRASDGAAGGLVNIESKVRLTDVEQSFVLGDKLAVMGRAGRTWSVVILDLAKGQEIDSFACALPQRLSTNRIAYVEWYPDHFVEPREVVLIYDLTKSPMENRLPGVRAARIPAPITDISAAVGLPVYPEWNVRNRSYRNAVENP